MNIIYSEYCLKDSEVRNFPLSRNRSKRIHKKLLKRFGSEYKKVPSMYLFKDTLFAHPFYKKELEYQFSQSYTDNPTRRFSSEASKIGDIRSYF